eukprot:7387790-Prymnesium_polylepis.1
MVVEDRSLQVCDRKDFVPRDERVAGVDDVQNQDGAGERAGKGVGLVDAVAARRYEAGRR